MNSRVDEFTNLVGLRAYFLDRIRKVVRVTDK